MTKTFLSTTACCFLMATAAIAQSDDTKAEDENKSQEEVSQEEMEAADEAAGVMFIEIYGDAVPTYMTTTEAIQRIRDMGYSNIHDLDVEWGNYEVEADAPDGNEVEIEFDPVTGGIRDISDNWF